MSIKKKNKKLWQTPLHHVDRLQEILNKDESPSQKIDCLLNYFKEEDLPIEQVVELLITILGVHFGTLSEEELENAEKELAKALGQIH